MSRIQTKFDHTLEQSEIIINLTNTSKDEAGEHYTDNKQEVQQTSIYGIQAPLIMVNNVVVDFNEIISFELDCSGILPTVSMEIKERKGLITSFDTPGIDNELRVQVIPKFDDKYKKINLTFYITNMFTSSESISIMGKYKAPSLTSSQIKSFGEINTYDLCEIIAKETGLGFASNIESNDGNKRWIYCSNKSYLDLLNHEIKFSSFDYNIFDFWIDPWNNLTLVDIYERYNAKDKEEEMMLWVTGQNKEMDEGNQPEPMEVPAIINNHPNSKTSELYADSYNISNTPSAQLAKGTDRLYSIYEMEKYEYMDHLIQDGSTKKDIFVNFEYLGEVYGSYNYLLSNKLREDFLQKIRSNESITVSLNYPLLGLLRGNKVDLIWYKNDDNTKNLGEKLDEFGITNSTNTKVEDPLINNLQTDGKFKTDNGGFEIDKSISGQYYINGWVLKFEESKWQHVLTLSRSTLEKPKIIDSENEK